MFQPIPSGKETNGHNDQAHGFANMQLNFLGAQGVQCRTNSHIPTNSHPAHVVSRPFSGRAWYGAFPIQVQNPGQTRTRWLHDMGLDRKMLLRSLRTSLARESLGVEAG